MLKAILFDLDGTLINSFPMYTRAYDLTLQTYGLKLTDPEVYKLCYGRTEEEICTDLKMPEKVEEFRKTYFSNVDRLCVDVELYPNAKQVLEYLKNSGLKLGIVTQAHGWYLTKMTDSLGIKSYFQSFSSFTDVKNPKPHPEAVFNFCKKLDISVEEVWMIGDSRYDIKMGQNSKCKTVLLLHLENEKIADFNELKKTNPDFVVYGFTELKELITKFQKS